MKKFAWYLELKEKRRVFYYKTSSCAKVGDLRQIELKVNILPIQQEFTEKHPWNSITGKTRLHVLILVQSDLYSRVSLPSFNSRPNALLASMKVVTTLSGVV